MDNCEKEKVKMPKCSDCQQSGRPSDERTCNRKVEPFCDLIPYQPAKPLQPKMDRSEQLAHEYIEGVGGLFDFYKYELASPLCLVKEVEGARWMIKCLIQPMNRGILDEITKESDRLISQEFPVSPLQERE